MSSVKARSKLVEEEDSQGRRRQAGRFSPEEDERIIRAVLEHNPAFLQVGDRHVFVCLRGLYGLLLCKNLL